MERDRLLLAVAYMRYVGRPRMLNKEIARRLKVSEPVVSRLLKEVDERSLLVYHLNVPRHEALENELQARFKEYGLIEARVARAWEGHDSGELRRIVAEAAARYFEEWETKRQEPFSVGVSGGLTLHETIRALRAPKPDLPSVSVYALVGTPLGDILVSANGLAAVLCSRYGVGAGSAQNQAKVAGYELPFQFESEKEKAAALKRPQVKMAFRGACGVDWAFVGLGALGAATSDSTTERILAEVHIKSASLRRQGAVAEVLGTCLDIHGKVIPTAVQERILAVPAKGLRALSKSPTRRVVGLASGGDKAVAVFATLRARCLNALVTDEGLASTLLGLWRGV